MVKKIKSELGNSLWHTDISSCEGQAESRRACPACWVTGSCLLAHLLPPFPFTPALASAGSHLAFDNRQELRVKTGPVTVVLLILCWMIYFCISFKPHSNSHFVDETTGGEKIHTHTVWQQLTTRWTWMCMASCPNLPPATTYGIGEKGSHLERFVPVLVPFKWLNSRTWLVLAVIGKTTPWTSSCHWEVSCREEW